MVYGSNRGKLAASYFGDVAMVPSVRAAGRGLVRVQRVALEDIGHLVYALGVPGSVSSRLHAGPDATLFAGVLALGRDLTRNGMTRSEALSHLHFNAHRKELSHV